MTDKELSREEWLAEERKRLKEGFTFEPRPPSEKVPGPAGDILAQLGLGAGVLAGAAAGHANPATFEGCRASTIVEALRSEFAGDDVRLAVNQSGETTIVTLLQSQKPAQPFSPALTVTLIETGDVLTVAIGDLSPGARRGAIASLGRTALRQSRDLLLRRRGLVGILDAAGNLVGDLEDVSGSIQDLTLPKRVWTIVDRVGRAAENAYLEEQRRTELRERKREEAERAWTHCEWCGRAYALDEGDTVQCPSCGAPRGPRPAWLT